MSNILAQGIYPALVSHFKNDGTILKDSIRANMDRNYAQGAGGFYICGSTGEGPVITKEMRMEIADTVMEHNNGRGIIINHIGAAATKDAFELARHAKEIGCHAISSVVPNFYFKHNDDEIIDFYKRIAEESQLPVLAYVQNLLTTDSVNLMSRLINVDGVIGCKFTLTDFYSMRRIKELNGGDINVINGPDEMLICGLSMGADAGIGSTYNLMCAEYVKLREAFLKGDLEEARRLQYKVNKVTEILIPYNVARAVKYILSLDGIEAGDMAYPMSPLTDAQKESLVKELTAVGFFDNYNK